MLLKYNIKKPMKLKIISFFICVLALTANCSKKDPVTGKKVRIDPNAISKAEKARDSKGSIIFGKKSGRGESSSSLSLGNTSILWKAALKSLENIPITESDYAGGIIITDWYGGGSKNGKVEDIKITVKFLSDKLSPTSLEVLTYKRICEKSICKTNKLNSPLSNKIKENILEEVRNLKISEELSKAKK